eukprot:CAMPEP_0198261966 /NCGR_PEP_ID=MMETSP1447-20131203/10556_1 /TAXON_ID=420782 /ORGANISM="Chaetoceros dichaeta, Strain CCMP1751" /LENGTH=399 /DNA_ID=CAMNT_0043950025 /DNA_START=86 /DNA_END=1285 /DNA_ORIENTATION=-
MSSSSSSSSSETATNTVMQDIPNLLASTFPDSFIGPVTVSPSRILGNEEECGNGLFITDDVSAGDVLLLIRPMDDAVISIEHALHDLDFGSDFTNLAEEYDGGETVAIAGWLAKTRICDILDQAALRDDDDDDDDDDYDYDEETKEMKMKDDKSTFLSAYISALPWLPKDQDHIIWWRQEEADDIFCGNGSDRDGLDDVDDGSRAMMEEAVRIRTEVASAIPLLAKIIAPIVRSKLKMLAPAVIEELLGFGGGMGDDLDIDTDLACNLLLSSYLRGAFVILMTRSFDDSFEGIGASSSYDNASEGGGRLVPVLDMCQHTTHNPNVYHVCDIDSDCIGLFAAQDISAGEELTISYHLGLDSGVFGARFGFVPGEARSFRVLLEERSNVLFPLTLPPSSNQ